MERFVLFLHLLGSVGLGFYLLLPFVAMKLKGLQPAGQAGYARGIHGLNRIGQWLLIVQFLTGGYLISSSNVSVPWIIVSIVLFLALGAASGMIAGPLKRVIGQGGGNKPIVPKDASRLSVLSGAASILVLLLLILMYYRELL